MLLPGKKQISLELAQDMLLLTASHVEDSEDISLLDAHHRVCFEPLYAVVPHPPFDRALVDGYALHYEDTVSASYDTPVVLPVSQHLFAGNAKGLPLASGESARVMTGAVLPPQANCVIWQEDTDEGDKNVTIFRPSKKFTNCQMAGEDLAVGERLLDRGDKIHSLTLGLLAGQGLRSVRVFRKPKIAIVATGDELYTGEAPLPFGKIYNTSSVVLSSRIVELKAQVTHVSLSCDDQEVIYTKLCQLIEENDIIITTGGVSVGKHDYMPFVANRLAESHGGKVLFQNIRLNPGARTVGASFGNKFLIALSGNPFAALTTFEMLAVPVIKKMSGENTFKSKKLEGIAMENVMANTKNTRQLLLAEMAGNNVYFRQSGERGSIDLSAGKYNCFVDIQPNSPPIKIGDNVSVILF